MKHFFRFGDFLIILLVIFAAIFTFYQTRPQKEAQTVTISVDGQVYRQFILPQENTLVLENGVVIQFEGMRVRILSSDCPDHTCVKNGWLTKAGQSSICLPNRTVLQLDGGDLIIGG